MVASEGVYFLSVSFRNRLRDEIEMRSQNSGNKTVIIIIKKINLKDIARC